MADSQKKTSENLNIVPEDLKEKYKNKSEAIRGLFKEGVDVAKIAQILNIRYQHAWNVAHRELKTEIKKERERNRKAPTEDTPTPDTSAELAMRQTPRLTSHRPPHLLNRGGEEGDS